MNRPPFIFLLRLLIIVSNASPTIDTAEPLDGSWLGRAVQRGHSSNFETSAGNGRLSPPILKSLSLFDICSPFDNVPDEAPAK